MTSSALEPGKIGVKRIKQSSNVGEKRAEEEQPNGEHGGQGKRDVSPPDQREQNPRRGGFWHCPQRRCDRRDCHCRNTDYKGFLGGEHKSQSAARRYRPTAGLCLHVTPASANGQGREKSKKHL